MLRQAGPGIGAFDVPNFTRVDQGLETLYANMSDAHVVNGQIVGSFWSDGYFLAKFDNASSRWTRIESPTWTSNAKFGSSVIRFDNDYSLDNGETWRDAPSLSDAVPNVSFRAERFRNQAIPNRRSASRQQRRLELTAATFALRNRPRAEQSGLDQGS